MVTVAAERSSLWTSEADLDMRALAAKASDADILQGEQFSQSLTLDIACKTQQLILKEVGLNGGHCTDHSHEFCRTGFISDVSFLHIVIKLVLVHLLLLSR